MYFCIIIFIFNDIMYFVILQHNNVLPLVKTVNVILNETWNTQW